MFHTNNIVKPREDKKLLKKIIKNNPLFKKINERKENKYVELKPKDPYKEKEVIY